MNSNELLQSVVSVPEAVTLLGTGLDTETIRKAIRKNQLPARKAYLGPRSRGIWLVVLSDVLALWPDGRRKPGAKPSRAPIVCPDESIG
jgi:hypothetical protein